jgi:NADPH2:quinone reductase
VKAIVHRDAGGPDVLRLVERELPAPGPVEVRVRVAVSGVNPADTQAAPAPPPASRRSRRTWTAPVSSTP